MHVWVTSWARPDPTPPIRPTTCPLFHTPAPHHPTTLPPIVHRHALQEFSSFSLPVQTGDRLFQVHWKRGFPWATRGKCVKSVSRRNRERERARGIDSAHCSALFSPAFSDTLRWMRGTCALERRVTGAAGKQRKTTAAATATATMSRILGRSFANSCKMAQAAQLDTDNAGESETAAGRAKESARCSKKRVTHLCNEASTGM